MKRVDKLKYKKEKGLTLLSLIITVIVLIILTMVTITSFKGGGIIDTSEDVVNEVEIDSAKTDIELSIAKKMVTSKNAITIEDIFEQLEQDGIIMPGDSNKETQQVKTKEQGYVFVIIKDENGNWKVIFEGNVEIQTPELTVSITKNTSSIVQSLILTITAQSNVGIKSYDAPGETTKTYGSGTTSITETYVVSENKTYTFTVINNNGNVRSSSITINNVDASAPTVTLSPNGGNYTAPDDGDPTTADGKATIKTTITASDVGVSGLKTLKYAWSESSTSEPTSWTDFTNGATVTKTDCVAGKIYYLWTNVVDAVGNRAQNVKVSNGFVVGSSTATTNSIKLTPNYNTWTNTDVTVTVSFGSNLTQGKTLTCTGTAGTDYTKNGTTSIVVKSNNQTVKATAKDAAGNTVTASLTITIIDKDEPTAPVIAVSSQTYATSQTVSVVTPSNDGDGSGIAYYEYYKSNTATVPTDETTGSVMTGK